MNTLDKKKTVAILRGGPSAEHAVSLVTGAGIIKNIDRTSYNIRDIIISLGGVWTVDGIKYSLPQEALVDIDIVLIALHGTYGEDGQVQSLLDVLNIPYAGTGAKASKVSMSKALTHGAVCETLEHPVKVAQRCIVTPYIWDAQRDEIITNIQEHIGFPCVVKPTLGGSSIGVSIIHAANDPAPCTKMVNAIDALVINNEEVVIEKFIAGREVTCAVMEDMLGTDIIALPLVEVILNSDQEFFDYDAKYNSKTTEVCPAHIDDATRDIIQEVSIAIHKKLDLRDYSRSDFILAEDNSIYFLEVNTLPGMTPTSFVPQALAAAGISYSAFIEHLIERALRQKK